MGGRVYFLLLLVQLVCFCISTSETQIYPAEDYVNILGGTDSNVDSSTGGTLPLITLPWGFNSYSPQTDNEDGNDEGGWWFHPEDRRFYGLRVTKQPSPWIGDYGNFLLKITMPHDTNPNKDASVAESDSPFIGYSPKLTHYSPFYYNTTLLPFCTQVSCTSIHFAPTRHGGILKTNFPSYVDDSGFEQTRRVAIILDGDKDFAEIGNYPKDGTLMISGFSKANSGGVGGDAAAFSHYFVAAIYGGPNGDIPVKTTIKSKADNTGAYLDFNPEDSSYDILTVRFATSFISHDQAVTNLEREVSASSFHFEDIVMSAKKEWNQVLSKINIDEIHPSYSDDEAKSLRVVFYSSLYRASIFPRLIDETTADGTTVHWSPYATTTSTRVQEGHLASDSGFWDAWNTIYPLLSLIHRTQTGKIISGWVNAFKEGGWLPKWSSPGYRGSMVGTMGDVSLADAIVNELPGFDVASAYASIRKDAFEIPPEGVDGIGRVCLASYLENGYIAKGSPMTTGGACYEVVSRTLNYLQSDYAISQAAKKLGNKQDADILSARSSNFSLLFDGETGLFRSRNLAGKFTSPFSPYSWGGDYTEGGPQQFRFYVPYNPQALSTLYKNNGRDMCEEFEQVQTADPAVVHIGHYSEMIHEQTELIDHCWGQYAHNNQPSHHMIYMFTGSSSSRCRHTAQYWIRKVVTELYKPTAAMFSGDEDNGEMGAWFVLSSLGLYNLSPGSGMYNIGSPLFQKVTLTLDGGKQLVIEAENNNKNSPYVQSVVFNDVAVAEDNRIPYRSLMQGGVLKFIMTDKKSE